MRVSLGEVAPLAPLLIPITEIALFLVALGIISMVTLFVKALLGGLSHAVSIIPGVGGLTSSALHSVEQAITSALGSAAGAISARIGAAEHELGRVVDWIGREISRHAGLLKIISEVLLGTAATSAVAALIGQLTRRAHGAQAQISSIVHRVIAAEERLAHGIGADVLPHIRALDHTIDHTLEPELAALKRRAKELEDGAIDTFKWIRTHPLSVASTAFAGAVAFALGRLGLGALRCSNFTNLLKKHGCNLGSLLERLLGLGVFLAIGFDFKAFVAAAQLVATGIGDTVAGIEGVFDLELPPLPPPNR